MKDKEKREILEKVEKNAVEAQLRDDTCARSTLHGLQTCFPFIPAEMVAASWCFSGGVASSSGSCGALCSSLLAIGAKYLPTMDEVASGSEEARRKFEKGKEKIFAFREAFMKEFGTTLCPEVQRKIFGRSYNLLDDKEREEFLSLPGHKEKCAAVVAKAARMAAEIILDDAES